MGTNRGEGESMVALGFTAWLSGWMVGLVSEMTFEESRFEGNLENPVWDKFSVRSWKDTWMK